MNKDSNWPSEPIETMIMTYIESNRKTIKEDELYNKIKQKYEKLSYQKFLKALMTLEICGKINVNTNRRGKKSITPTER